ncbi:MAG: NUDIX domain-containing protein [Armatimonadota bacterium]
MRRCAGGLMREGKILLAKRAPDRRLYPGVWDSVGGHCAPDEQPAGALVREIQEELGVTARRFKEIAAVDEPRAAEYGEASYHVFVVTV